MTHTKPFEKRTIRCVRACTTLLLGAVLATICLPLGAATLWVQPSALSTPGRASFHVALQAELGDFVKAEVVLVSSAAALVGYQARLEGQAAVVEGTVSLLADAIRKLEISELLAATAVLAPGDASVRLEFEVTDARSGEVAVTTQVLALRVEYREDGDDSADALGSLTCADGEVAKWDAGLGEWVCADLSGLRTDLAFANQSDIAAVAGDVATNTSDIAALPTVQSGMIDIDLAALDFVDTEATQVVPFPSSFTSVPVVTLTVVSEDAGIGALVDPVITDLTVADFDMEVTVPGGANTLSIDAGGSVGKYTSLAVVNGRPAISYYDSTNEDLKYVGAKDANGSAWGMPVSVDTMWDVGTYTSLAVVNTFPAISYFDATRNDLKYVRASNATGNAWGEPVTVDTGGGQWSDRRANVGLFTSLAVVNGHPAISYFDRTNGDLKYVRAANPGGRDWGPPVSVDTAGSVGQYTSLAVVSGHPAISYFDATGNDLKYVRASDANGFTWGTPVSVEVAGDVGEYTSLAVVNGHPAISYYDRSDGNLMYVRATDATGRLWPGSVTVDTTAFTFTDAYTSLAVVNGRPAISYYDSTNRDLKYVRASDANGFTWGTPVSVDTAGSVGQYASMAVINGHPAISYRDYSNEDLKYAIPGIPAASVNWIAVGP